MTHQNFKFEKGIRFCCSARQSRRALLVATFIMTLLAAALPVFNSTSASAPTGATLDPTATTPLTWTGTGTGGGALNAPLLIGGEDLCQEGISCDTFTLNVGGTTA